MISLVLDQTDPYAFENLVKRLTPMIKRVVSPFARDRMLARTEDVDSLTNLCLWKLHQAHHDFVYEDKFTEEHNQRRFIGVIACYGYVRLVETWGHTGSIHCQKDILAARRSQNPEFRGSCEPWRQSTTCGS